MPSSRWLVYVGLVVAFLGSIYLGRIAYTAQVTDLPGWGEAGYGVVVD